MHDLGWKTCIQNFDSFVRCTLMGNQPSPQFPSLHSWQCYCVSMFICYCCRNGNQLLDFSVPELVGSQSTFSTGPDVLHNYAGFTLCSSSGLAVRECSAVMVWHHACCVYRFTVCCLYWIIICWILCELSVNDRPIFLKPLCLLSTPQGLATTNYQRT